MPTKQITKSKAKLKYTKRNKNCNSRVLKYKRHIKAGNSIRNNIGRAYNFKKTFRHVLFIICLFILIGLLIYSFLNKKK